MLNTMFICKVTCAAFATVGIVEWLKNFLNFSNKKIWAYIMIPICIGCYLAAELLPVWVIGSLLTLGTVQISYQTLIQGFDSVIKNISRGSFNGGGHDTSDM